MFPVGFCDIFETYFLFLDFLEFEGIQAAKVEEKASAKRAKTAVIGDTQPMMEALSNVSSFLQDVSTLREKKISYVFVFSPFDFGV